MLSWCYPGGGVNKNNVILSVILCYPGGGVCQNNVILNVILVLSCVILAVVCVILIVILVLSCVILCYPVLSWRCGVVQLFTQNKLLYKFAKFKIHLHKFNIN